MTRYLLAGAAALGMMTGAAVAQTSSSETTTTTTTPAVVAPVTVSTSSSIGRAAMADGDQTATNSSTSRDSNGNVIETTITNQSYPLTGMVTTTKKTTHIVNGVATETTEMTNTYPASTMRQPEVTTSTRTYTVGSR
jgi:hypothetical protein